MQVIIFPVFTLIKTKEKNNSTFQVLILILSHIYIRHININRCINLTKRSFNEKKSWDLQSFSKKTKTKNKTLISPLINLKAYKNLFENMKNNFKKLDYLENNVKSTWKIMKNILGTTKVKKRCIAWISAGGQKWNNKKRDDMNSGPNPALVITESSISFETYLTKSEAFLDENMLKKYEFKGACDSLKCHDTGSDEIHVNAIISV